MFNVVNIKYRVKFFIFDILEYHITVKTVTKSLGNCVSLVKLPLLWADFFIPINDLLCTIFIFILLI